MAAVIGALRAELSASLAQFEADMGKAAKILGRFGDQAAKTGEKISRIGRDMSMKVTLPIVAAGTAIVATAGKFEAGMNRVGAATMASKDQLKAMSDQARQLGPAMGALPSSVADAMENLAKNGLNVEKILGGATEATVLLAKSTGGELAPAADLVTDLMTQFKKSAGDMGKVVDNVNGVLIASKLGFDDYRLALGQAGGVAGSLGVTFEDFNAALAATAPLFASGSDAGTSFKTFLTRLMPTGKEAKDMMTALKLSFYDASGQMKSMGQIAQELKDKIGNLSQADQSKALTTIFGTDAMRTAIGLMNQGAEGIANFDKQVRAVSATDQMNAKLDGLTGALAKLSAQLEELAISIAESGLLTFVADAVKWLTEGVKWLKDNTGEWGNFAIKVAVVAAVLGPMVTLLGGVVGSMRTLAWVITKTLLPALWALKAGFEAAKVAAGGLDAALGILKKNPLIAAAGMIIGEQENVNAMIADMDASAKHGAAMNEKYGKSFGFLAQTMGSVVDAYGGLDAVMAKPLGETGKINPGAKLPFTVAKPTATTARAPAGTLDALLDDVGGTSGAKAAAAKAERIAEGVDRAKESISDLGKEIANLGRDDVGGLPQRLREVDDRFASATEKINDQIDALTRLGGKGGAVGDQLKVLQTMLGQVASAHDKATAAAKAQYAAENEIANLKTQQQNAGISDQISDLQQAGGSKGIMSQQQLTVKKYEDELASDRLNALTQLRQLETQREEAMRTQDTDAAARLTTTIALQQQYYDLLGSTTAEQLSSIDRQKKAWGDFETGLTDSLMGAVDDWKGSLDDIGSLFEDLAKQLFLKPFMEGISSDVTGWLKDAAGGGGDFAGLFADGGRIGAGDWGIVGEDGPEVARARGGGLDIKPLDGKNLGTTVVQNITTKDADSFRRTARQTARMAKRVMGT